MTVYSVQEIWGDGDDHPILNELKLFLDPTKAVQHCYDRFEQMEKTQAKQILYNDIKECVIVYDLSDLHTINKVEYCMFSGFLITIHEDVR